MLSNIKIAFHYLDKETMIRLITMLKPKLEYAEAV